MNELCFRINPYTFIRQYPEYIYLENQVSHTQAKLPREEFEILANPIYTQSYSVNQFAQYTNVTKILQMLHDAWLIDIEGGSDLSKRKFSYETKAYIDSLFADSQPINLITTQTRPILRNLQIELTDACNERCIHCYLPNTKKDHCKALSKEQVIELLHQYREMQGLKVVFSGGEILLHPDLFDILDECKQLNLMILLQSNLLSLSEDNLQRLKELEVFNVQVSLYSTEEHIHESITRRKGSFAKTKHNLELLVRHNIPAMISCPVMKSNYSTVRSLHRYAQELGVDIYFDYMMMAECDGCIDNLSTRLSLEQARKMQLFYIESNPLFIDAIKNSKTLEEALSKQYARRRSMCSIMSASVCVDSDGSVYPCPGWNGMKLGNISSSRLADIWDCEEANKLRSVNINDFEKCRICNNHNFCNMCVVYNHNENGDLYNICHRFCEMAEMLRECVIEKYNQLH